MGDESRKYVGIGTTDGTSVPHIDGEVASSILPFITSYDQRRAACADRRRAQALGVPRQKPMHATCSTAERVPPMAPQPCSAFTAGAAWGSGKWGSG